jgi:vesicle coat complex subunit
MKKCFINKLNFIFSPDILKNEMKVFFVKYNDPIYVKLEKLDIMIRLTNATNIAQVLAELKEYV